MTRLQRLIVWATLSVAALAVLFPKVKYYRWFNASYRHERGWHEVYPDVIPPEFDQRRVLFELDRYRANRPNLPRMATEVAVVLMIGAGLVLALKPTNREKS